ncbi:hypothetical protein E0E54_14195 [Azotobacter chroococcum]|uniref:hypothetical protein n=1 Tax=Azotobacter chroococcum TaxID=353 RepID=UPI00103A721F|nr:hypothetical protein [Azotobacter chroococcum]TBW34457.1 hypothetical protein E0E54_14195 [Azotobacter chroococcum]
MDKRRLLGWLAFLGVAGLLALLPEFFPQEAEPLAVAPRSRPAVAPDEQEAAQPESRALRSVASSRAVPQADLFAARSWHAPPARRPLDAAPAKAAALTPPAPPAAPPLPFEFIGRLDDSVRLRVFLLRGDHLHTVQAGDVIDGTYRVEKVAADELTFVYLPLKQTQTLSVGDNP